MALVLAGQQNAAPCGSLKFLSRHAGTGCDLGGVEIAGLVNQVLCSCSVGLVVFLVLLFHCSENSHAATVGVGH